MTHVLNKRCLHLLRLHGLVIRLAQFYQVLLARLHNIYQSDNQQGEQEYSTQQGGGTYGSRLLLCLVQLNLFLNALHTVAQHHIIDRVAGQRFLFKCFVGFLPSAGTLVNQRDGIGTLVTQLAFGIFDGLVNLTCSSQVVGFHATSVNRRQTFPLALLIHLVTL